MKLVLLEDVRGKGKKGDLVEVSDGYAKNFLLPRKLAKQADAQILTEIKNAKTAQKYKQEMEIKKAKEVLELINEKSVKIRAKAGENGKLFGTVTAKDIASEINRVFKTNIDKRKIKTDVAIKAFGTYKCEVKLHAGIIAQVYAMVIEEEN